MKPTFAVLLCIAATACAGPSPTASAVKVVAAAPTSGAPLTRHAVAGGAAAQSLGLASGAVAAGTPSGLFLAAAAGADSVDHAMVVSTDGATSTGAITALAPRDNGSLLVAADEGLFTTSEANLVSSPLTQSLPKATFTSLSSIGTGSQEEVWLLSSQGLLHVAGGHVNQVSFSGAGTPTLVLAVGPGEALVFSGGSLWDVNVGSDKATELASSLGTASGAARDASGTAWIATDAGLVSRSATGQLTRFTFASSGAAPQRVCGVSASSAGVFAATSTSLLQVSGETAAVLATVQQPSGACPLVVDAQSNIYIADHQGLGRFAASGLSVSFTAQIKPFFEQHCMTCHANATQGAPKVAFDDYATAKQYGPVIAMRVQDTQAPMPPASTEVLKAADIDLIVRWTQEGYAP